MFSKLSKSYKKVFDLLEVYLITLIIMFFFAKEFIIVSSFN